MNAIRVSLGISLLAVPLLAQADFSGKWEFNPSLSKNVGMMAQMKLSVTIRQTRDELIASSVSSFNGSDQTSELHLDLTGKSVPNKNPMEATADTVTKWEGPRLLTTWTSPGSVAGSRSVRLETRYLSEDGRLTVESKRGNAPPIVMVYERK